MEYKRRAMIQINDILKKKSPREIRIYMAKFTKKKFTNIRSKQKLIHSALTYLYKQPWSKLKLILKEQNTSKSRKTNQTTKRRKTRRKR